MRKHSDEREKSSSKSINISSNHKKWHFGIPQCSRWSTTEHLSKMMAQMVFSCIHLILQGRQQREQDNEINREIPDRCYLNYRHPCWDTELRDALSEISWHCNSLWLEAGADDERNCREKELRRRLRKWLMRILCNFNM